MARLPIDFGDSTADNQAAADYSARLPIELPQQAVTPADAQAFYDRADNLITGSNPDLPTLFPSVHQGIDTLRNNGLASGQQIFDRTFGTNNTERVQTWPEKMVRNAVAGDPASFAMDPDTGEFHTSPETIERANDIAGMAGGGFAAKPNAITAMADSARVGAPIAALEHAPRFYSAVEKAVKEAKQPTATSDQWLGYLRNQPGVKQEELDWTLGQLPPGQISKPDLEKFVQDHKIELKEVNKDQGQEVTINDGGTKFSQYQLPGGSNYREMLMTLPSKYGVKDLPESWNVEKTNNVYRVRGTWNGENNVILGYGNTPNEAAHSALAETNTKGQEHYTSSHWSEPNVLAHVRMNDRTIPDPSGNGGPLNSSHIEEIQSDWHQAGRKQGYQGEADKLQPQFDKIEKKILDSNDEAVMSHPELSNALKMAVDKKIITPDEAKIYKRYSDISASGSTGVPDAPFKTSWPDLMLKRLIRHAAEEGKDSISWTPGEAQAARYDLSKHYDTINAIKREDGAYELKGKLVNGTRQNIANRATKENLADYVGKELSEKIIKQDGGKFEGLDLKVGGEGMHAFYDKILVDKANALGKKFGAKVEKGNIEAGKKKYEIINNRTGERRITDNIGEASQAADKDPAGIDVNTIHDPQPVHILKLTPQLRDAALKKGFSLFADTGKVGAPLAALTKVDHNPFTVDTYHGSPNPIQGERIRPMSGIQIGKDDYAGQPISYHVYDSVNRKYLKSDFATHEEAQNWVDKNALADFYSTPNPQLASDYATHNPYGKGKNITPLKLNTNNYHTIDAKGQPWDAVNQFAINEANQLKKQGVIIKNVYDDADPLRGNRGPQTVYITLDPSTVRSRFAKFDPGKFHESGLLKATGLPIITDKDGNELNAQLKPLKDLDEQNASTNRQPLPSHGIPQAPLNVGISPTATKLGLAKAAEWAAFVAARNYPKIAGPMYTSWVAQWPILGHMLRADVEKQIKAGVKPEDVEFKPGTIGDLFGIISSLKKKYGDKADTLTPVEHDPFKEKK